jgi:GntR family transcriptional regulator
VTAVTVDRSAPDWPYQQIAAVLRQQITSGEIGPKLPSHMDLAEQLGVAPRTVARALGLLKDEGLVTARPGRGTFVRER